MRAHYFKVPAILAGLLSLTLLSMNNCSPLTGSGFRGINSAQGKSFDQLSYEYDPNNPPSSPVTPGGPNNPVNTTPPAPPPPQTQTLVVDPDTVSRCETGELDIVHFAQVCHVPANLIFTVLDSSKETVLFRSNLASGQSIDSLVAQLIPTMQTTFTGTNVHVFVCIDHNGNDKCADEPVIDINPLTIGLGWALQSYGGWDRVQYSIDAFGLVTGRVAPAILAATGGRFPKCDEMRSGLVLFHKQLNLGTAPQSAVAGAMQDVLKNLPSRGSYQPSSAGATTVSVPLAISNPAICPAPAPRVAGCFVKGTRIAVTPELSVEIEHLRAGHSVHLADGRYAKIKRVVAGPESKPVIRFETADGRKLTVTTEHPLITNKGLRMAKEISIGEELKTHDGKFTAIKGISTKKYNDDVINFEVEGEFQSDHLVIAEGLISGDLYLQNKLATDKKSISPGLLTAK